MSALILSKSKFTQSLQCMKLLWLDQHDPDRLEKFSAFTEHILHEGQRFGHLAQQKFPGGTEIPFKRENRKQRVRMTRDLIKQGADVIYEASFLYEDFIVMVDILRKDEDGKWEIYEVKSKTKVEDYLIPDAAVQKFILTQCGLEVSHTYFITPSSDYILDGELDLNAFLNITNVDVEVESWLW